MAKFRKRPVEIEAIQWDGSAACLQRLMKFIQPSRFQNDGETLLIPTLEGAMRANVGDWIIRGVQGEFYPCKPDIFDATYEPVDA